MSTEVVAALSDPSALKVVATISPAGVPNAVIVATVFPLDPKTIIFADLKLGKTKENLLQNRRFTVAVLRPSLDSYQVRGTFNRFEERGQVTDMIAEKVFEMSRLQPRGIVYGAVEEVYSTSLSNPGTRLA
ncbi:MAG: pyridoxamine 5'-phosphate oxidase family protein [Chloroflexota bacterium]|nr:pyridoxamine 5'-phosphate oxidase family protein [Chloroflexota bacterium]